MPVEESNITGTGEEGTGAGTGIDTDSDSSNSIIHSIEKGVSSIGNFFKDGIDGLGNIIGNGFDKFNNFVTDILDGIKGLFIPSEGYLEDKVSELRERFSFADSIISTVERFKGLLKNVQGKEAPSITIRLDASTSKIDYGKSSEWLNMNWYAPYKETGDKIISAFLWVVFLWGTFTRLPSIISGGSAGTVAFSKLNDNDKG